MLNFVILTLKVLSEPKSSCTFLFTSVLVSSDGETWGFFPFESLFCSCPSLCDRKDQGIDLAKPLTQMFVSVSASCGGFRGQ